MLDLHALTVLTLSSSRISNSAAFGSFFICTGCTTCKKSQLLNIPALQQCLAGGGGLQHGLG